MAREPFKSRSGVGSAAVKAAVFIFGLTAIDSTVPANAEDPAKSAPKKKIVITVGVPSKTMTKQSFTLNPASFADLPGWAEDDHLSAWKAFLSSCPVLVQRADAGKATKPMSQTLAGTCRFALSQAASGKKMTKASARAFFEANFRPRRVDQTISGGLLTGYYEPMLQASRTPQGEFTTPIYRRPPDLVNMVSESDRGAKSEKFTHMRKTDDGLVPFLTRAEIEQGGLSGQGLELLYFRDPVDVYFLQVQGSGHIELPDGQKIRIGYDGKNGYPYTSIGRELIQAGTFTMDNMSLKALSKWLKADRERAAPVMWKNQSYVFFRELTDNDGDGPVGALGTSLHSGRSLAVDTAYHALGVPIYVSAPTLKHATRNPSGFNRLMIAQDVGSAIKGPERGDIFFGSGDKAGRIAGVTKHPGHFFVLEPAPAIEARGEPQQGRRP
ncbi:MAG: murein transglycosylase A [Hyphomicrobium sp.]